MYLAVAYPILCDNYNPKLHINRVTPCNCEQTVVFNASTISTNCLYVLSLLKKTKRTHMCVSFQIRKNVPQTWSILGVFFNRVLPYMEVPRLWITFDLVSWLFRDHNCHMNSTNKTFSKPMMCIHQSVGLHYLHAYDWLNMQHNHRQMGDVVKHSLHFVMNLNTMIADIVLEKTKQWWPREKTSTAENESKHKMIEGEAWVNPIFEHSGHQLYLTITKTVKFAIAAKLIECHVIH